MAQTQSNTEWWWNLAKQNDEVVVNGNEALKGFGWSSQPCRANSWWGEAQWTCTEGEGSVLPRKWRSMTGVLELGGRWGKGVGVILSSGRNLWLSSEACVLLIKRGCHAHSTCERANNYHYPSSLFYQWLHSASLFVSGNARSVWKSEIQRFIENWFYFHFTWLNSFNGQKYIVTHPDLVSETAAMVKDTVHFLLKKYPDGISWSV